MASGATRHSEPLGGVPARPVPSLSRAFTCESASVMARGHPPPRPSWFRHGSGQEGPPGEGKPCSHGGGLAPMPGRLLVAVDLSAEGRAALDAAVALAQDLRASLVLVHVASRVLVAPDLAAGAAAPLDPIGPVPVPLAVAS